MLAWLINGQDKSEETIMPNSLTHFPVLRLVPNEYLGRESSHLCVIRKTSHLLELKWSCHLDAQDTNWSTSNCKASLSLAMFDSSLYTLGSSANILTVNKSQIVSGLSECFWNRLIKQKRLSFLFIKPVCPAHFVY